MPIYEFRCTKCHKKFEILCRMGETGENLSCPECGQPKPVRVMSGFFASGVEIAKGESGCSTCSGGSCSGCKH